VALLSLPGLVGKRMEQSIRPCPVCYLSIYLSSDTAQNLTVEYCCT